MHKENLAGVQGLRDGCSVTVVRLSRVSAVTRQIEQK